MAQPLSELLRPTELEDLVQPLSVIEGLRRSVKSGRAFNMLLYGSPGIGKTSAARILFRMLDAQVYEINGSLDTGVETIRDLKVFVSSMSLFGKEKVVFIDECEYLSKNAQAGLRGLIERMPEVSYVLTANDIKKLHSALKSRCIPISFEMTLADVSNNLPRIIDRYEERLKGFGLQLDRTRLEAIVHIYLPDLRAIANRIEFEAQPIKKKRLAA